MWLLRANKCIQAIHVANGSFGVNNYGGPSTEVGRSETDVSWVTVIRPN